MSKASIFMAGVILTVLAFSTHSELQKDKQLIKKPPKGYTYQLVPLRDYQIDIVSEDTMLLFDGNRLVGKLFLTDDTEIGSLIYKDNE